MLIVTDLQGNSEPVADYKSLEINEEINGDFSLSCLFLNTANNQYAWDLIAEESIIEHDGHEYRIKRKVVETHRKQVHALHTYFDLITHRIYGITGGTMYPADTFSFALAGSGWTCEIMDDIPPQLLFNFGEDNAVSLVKKAREAFNCEVKICPGMHLQVYKRIGKDDDYQFRYRHNIKAIKETVDTTKLATVIKGYGGNALEVTYTSPNHSVFGERHAEPIRDDRYTIADSMLERLKQELVDTPEVSLELEAIMLEGTNLGDTVWLIHEKLGIEFQTRIMAQKRRPRTPKADTVTLGNRKVTLSDLLTETKVEINESKKETRSKIEQTNEKITIEVERVDEAIGTLQVAADNINIEVQRLDGEIQEAYSQIDVKAGEVLIESKSYTDDGINSAYNYFDGEIESVQSSIAVIAGTVELKASVDYVDNQVNNLNDTLGGRISSAESALSVQAGQISSKVSQTDYNGNTIASLINQTAGAVVIDAQKINLLGITNVANQLNIGDSYNDSTAKGIYFRGPLGGVNIVSNTQGMLEIGALNTLYLNPTYLDLSMPSSIIWGNNAPVARFG